MPTSANLQDQPNARRHWLQFRLRTLLVLMAIVSFAAVAFAQYREWRRRVRAREQFEKTIEIYDPVPRVSLPGIE